MIFKPGMPFQAQIAVRYSDQVALDQEKLEQSTLSLKMFATLKEGKVPKFNLFAGPNRGQPPGGF